ncbi:hypothetical protein WG66_003787 [Moniliophthora roreri]|nr:hypothetical protein WG66_003787 [Moniliophthora roreri]
MVLTVKSVQSLPIPDLKIKASSGSPAALFELGRRASQRPHLLVEVLPIFLNHLSSPPDFSTLKESQRDERIAAARHAIIALTEAFSKDAFRVPQVLEEIEKGWNHLQNWISFLSDTYILTDSSAFASLPLLSDEDRDKLHLVLARFLYPFTSLRRTARLLTHESNCFSIAIRLYLIGAQNPPFSLTGNKTHDDILLYCSRIFDGMQKQPASGVDYVDWPNTILMTLNNASPSLTSGIIQRIVYEISRPSSEDFNFPSLKLALTMFINLAMNPIRFNWACIQRRSIYWVCLTMRRISGRRARFHEQDVADCLKVCATYLERTFQDFGHAAVVEALRARLLSTLLKSADFIPVDQKNLMSMIPSSLATTYKSLLHIIAGFSMYYSVSTVLRKSLRIVLERHHDERSKSKALSSDFKLFMKTMDDRLFLGYYSWGMHGMNYCVYAKCPMPAHASSVTKRIPMFRCSGCSLAYYCSAECQRLDWTLGHQIKCRSIQNVPTHKFVPGLRLAPSIDARDLRFISWLIQQYILQLRPTLLAQQSKYRVKSDLPSSEPLVSVLNYIEFPCKVDTITGMKARKRVPNENWDSLLVKAQENVGKEPLVLAFIPDRSHEPHIWVGFGRIVAS